MTEFHITNADMEFLEANSLRAEVERLRAENEALRKDAERLLDVLVAVRAALDYENGKAITDTLWMIPFDYTGTVFDYIDAAIDAARLRTGDTQ